jgi:hypothetical protein
MPETEVESILREIRERVLSQERAGQNVAGMAARTAMTNAGNGASDSDSRGMQYPGPLAAENLALISSYLTTTARAWDRLPPVVSNRSGLLSRLELWLKRRLKAGTRWFTWEQVNFNAALHHAVRDLLPLLSAYEQELERLRAQIDAEAEARRVELAQLQTAKASRDAEIEALLVTAQKHQQGMESQASKFDSSLAVLAGELRERVERLQEEQRVCFKQLALETSEAAVLEDRARHKTEGLLEELQQRVEQLAKSKT